MFTLVDSLKIITIDQTYMKSLYDACHEVFYMPSSYENKPYIGILISSAGKEYAIPLTSAKEKHKLWKNYHNGNFLVYEICDLSRMAAGDVWVNVPDDSTGAKVKHIMAALIIPKMIPIKKEAYQIVNINVADGDPTDLINYKNLLNKEFAFCVSIKERIINFRLQSVTSNVRRFEMDRIFPGCCNPHPSFTSDVMRRM